MKMLIAPFDLPLVGEATPDPNPDLHYLVKVKHETEWNKVFKLVELMEEQEFAGKKGWGIWDEDWQVIFTTDHYGDPPDTSKTNPVPKTINRSTKVVKEALWDALSNILEDPATMVTDALRDEGLTAIELAQNEQVAECVDAPSETGLALERTRDSEG